MFNKNLNNQNDLSEKDEVRLAIWETSFEIRRIDKNYKFYRKEDIKKAIKDGSIALSMIIITYLCGLRVENIPTFADTAMGIIGPISASIFALSSSFNLGTAFSYKIRKKSLENKLENLKSKQNEILGIIEVDDYEIIPVVDEVQLDNQLLLEQNNIKSEGGKHVR